MNAQQIWNDHQSTLMTFFSSFEQFEYWLQTANDKVTALQNLGVELSQSGQLPPLPPMSTNEGFTGQAWSRPSHFELPPMPTEPAPWRTSIDRLAPSNGHTPSTESHPQWHNDPQQNVPAQATESHPQLRQADDPRPPKIPKMLRAERAMAPADRYSDKKVARSLLVLFFETAMSIIMVVVDFLTNIAFFVGGSGVFEPLSQSTPIHWAFGALFVFSEPVAFWKTRHTWEALKNRDFEDAAKHGTAAFAAWLAVAVNFVATYLPMEGQVKGAGEPWSWIIGLSIALLAAYFSAEVFKNILSLWRALSR